MTILAAAKNIKKITKAKVALPRIDCYLKKSSKNVNKEDLISIIDNMVNRGNLKAQGHEPNIYYYVPNQHEGSVLTSHTYEPYNDEDQGKRVATDNILNVTPLLKEMINDGMPAYQTTTVSNHLFRFLETLN